MDADFRIIDFDLVDDRAQVFSTDSRSLMLKPEERQHLLELLRPPAGCKLDVAVGTTFSLDLISALMLPLSFAFFDWERADGELIGDPLALLEALRRYGDRFTVFCQAGQIRLPQKKYGSSGNRVGVLGNFRGPEGCM